MSPSGLSHVERGRQSLTFVQSLRADDAVRRAMEREPGWLSRLCWAACDRLREGGTQVLFRALRDEEVPVPQAALDVAILKALNQRVSKL